MSVPRGRDGTSRWGCLLTLVLLAAGVYYGVGIGTVWFRYYRLLDEMKVQTRVAPSIPDATIRRRLLARIDELGLPDEARQLRIRRTTRPRRIEITTEYQETVDLPFTTYTFTFRPRATAPL